MDKNTYFETVKKIAIEKVLNQYSSESDPSHIYEIQQIFQLRYFEQTQNS
ncbi:hypothetical protein Clst_0866 [Thermoclostridium stercorarium subsp. stercorarium DSM 8532]|jgi:hypothetical protein|nr:hypothetical protein Clst_0866 [Thermoclostridium stercorarium subsp. stercorarium DSM 8532]